MVAPRNANDKRYDRQLRIWGAHGQAALESARVCLLNAGPTGSEALKNLVLGGIASFTIVDGSKVQDRDLGNNFFLETASLGLPRAQCVAGLLKELNESVSASFAEEVPAHLIVANPDFFKAFDVVIATQMPESELLQLEAVTRKLGVHLLVARSYGLMGYFRTSVGEHWVVESKPDNVAEDLRLSQPWPALEAYAHSFDMATLDDVTHKHVPYAVLLIKAAKCWKEAHDGTLPSTSTERTQFKQMLSAGQHHIDGIPLDEENYVEAISNAHKMWATASIDQEVRRILADPAVCVTPESSDFWFLAAALKDFVDNEGCGRLPLEGSIPDMVATTELYLRLQRFYRERAEEDASAVEAHLHAHLVGQGRSTASITHATAKQFCKNSRNLRVVRYRLLADEVHGSRCRSEAVRAALNSEGSATDAALYVLLRAADRFAVTHQRAPGQNAADCEADVPALKALATAILVEVGAQGASAAVTDDLVGEICRFGAGELHCVASVMGGLAAQEAIKLITRQFVPVAGTLIYNSMASTTSVFEF